MVCTTGFLVKGKVASSKTMRCDLSLLRCQALTPGIFVEMLWKLLLRRV
jgi:hypothetical protein